ncbi:MAG: hypothetical protein QNI99_11400 [Woeseiaceae bacterium]|nr:hypothetical protein [Woeseiaceae bacterium]
MDPSTLATDQAARVISFNHRLSRLPVPLDKCRAEVRKLRVGSQRDDLEARLLQQLLAISELGFGHEARNDCLRPFRQHVCNGIKFKCLRIEEKPAIVYDDQAMIGEARPEIFEWFRRDVAARVLRDESVAGPGELECANVDGFITQSVD